MGFQTATFKLDLLNGTSLVGGGSTFFFRLFPGIVSHTLILPTHSVKSANLLVALLQFFVKWVSDAPYLMKGGVYIFSFREGSYWRCCIEWIKRIQWRWSNPDIGNYVHMAGTKKERQRASEYLNCVMDQLKGPVHMETEEIFALWPAFPIWNFLQ